MLGDEPRLTPMETLAFTAWRDLCGERAVGFSLGPVPWRAIVAWCDRYRVADAEWLIELVQSIDTEWLANAAQRVKSAGDSRPAPGAERH